MKTQQHPAHPPIVSVLLPAFNAEAYLPEAIHSIQKQTLHDWELLILDDGSTDHTAAIAEGIASNDNRIEVIRFPHRGIVPTLEEGRKRARAEFIARMDADDIAHPDRLSRQYAYLVEHPQVDAVACQVHHFPDDPSSEGMRTYVAWSNSVTLPDDIRKQRFVDAPMIHPTLTFRTSALDRFGGYREGDFPEDYELFLRWIDAGACFSKIPELLLHWRDHPNKLTRQNPRYRPSAIQNLKGLHCSLWLQQHLEPNRPLMIWGAGRRTRSRLSSIPAIGSTYPIAAYIDYDPKKIGQIIHGVPVWAPHQALLKHKNPFILVMVGSRGARNHIRQVLKQFQKSEEIDFLFLA